MATVAIIPARGGSRRIPRKNLKELKGKPLLAYTIDCCKKSGVIDYIIVTSEDEEILNYCQSQDILTHKRETRLAQEITNNELAETRALVLKYLNHELDITVTKHLFLLPTYPFRSLKDIQIAVKALDTCKYVNSIEELSSASLEIFKEEERKTLKLEETEKLVRWNSFLSGVNHLEKEVKKRYFFHTVNKIQNIDIDTPLDWIQAEFVIEKKLFNFETGEIAKWPLIDF